MDEAVESPITPYEKSLVLYDIAILASCWLGGMNDKEILEYYPALTQGQLDYAHTYVEENWAEIAELLGEAW